jgi:drug/metabolite transporter (DMT)-like permease
VATVGGAALLGESVSSSTALGFLVIFAGFVVLASRPMTAELLPRVRRLIVLLGWHDETERSPI